MCGSKINARSITGGVSCCLAVRLGTLLVAASTSWHLTLTRVRSRRRGQLSCLPPPVTGMCTRRCASVVSCHDVQECNAARTPYMCVMRCARVQRGADPIYVCDARAQGLGRSMHSSAESARPAQWCSVQQLIFIFTQKYGRGLFMSYPGRWIGKTSKLSFFRDSHCRLLRPRTHLL